MAQTLLSWSNGRVRRAALLEVLPFEEQGEVLDTDHPSAYMRLTGGSQRRDHLRLPAVPIRWDDAVYADGVNEVEEAMIALLDGEVGQDELDDEYDLVWLPGAKDLFPKGEAQRSFDPTRRQPESHRTSGRRSSQRRRHPRRSTSATTPTAPLRIAAAAPPTKLLPPAPRTPPTTPSLSWDDVVL
ncbi:hypothetical protein KKF05_02185 [Patescibacteria group bacterium]|nr:hypothetical protein [Patescibacteria group bacterium]MBU1029518.1 hypothetical protein [Patescibacteria group bacterium]